MTTPSGFDGLNLPWVDQVRLKCAVHRFCSWRHPDQLVSPDSPIGQAILMVDVSLLSSMVNVLTLAAAAEDS